MIVEPQTTQSLLSIPFACVYPLLTLRVKVTHKIKKGSKIEIRFFFYLNSTKKIQWWFTFNQLTICLFDVLFCWLFELFYNTTPQIYLYIYFLLRLPLKQQQQQANIIDSISSDLFRLLNWYEVIHFSQLWWSNPLAIRLFNIIYYEWQEKESHFHEDVIKKWKKKQRTSR